MRGIVRWGRAGRAEGKARRQPETDIRNAVLDLLGRHSNIYAWVNKNSPTYDPRRQIWRANNVEKGVADILGIIKGGQFLAIETKTPAGLKAFHRDKIKPNETAWFEARYGERIIAMGGIWFLATSAFDAQNELSKLNII